MITIAWNLDRLYCSLNAILKIKNIINYLKVSNFIKFKKCFAKTFLNKKLFTWLNTDSILTFNYNNDLQFFFKTFLFYEYFSIFNKNSRYFIKKFEIFLKTKKETLLYLVRYLKQNILIGNKYLIDIYVYDVLGKKNRFTVNYLITSVQSNLKHFIVVKTTEIDPLPTVTCYFKSAYWVEREVWDMFGIFFKNHLDLRRILTDYGFKGHPLRKDFPVTGYVDLFYDEKEKKLVYTNSELSQEFRNFTFLNLWKN